MGAGVLGEANASGVIFVDSGGLPADLLYSSAKRVRSHFASAAARLAAEYSASHELMATLRCFLEAHEMREPASQKT